ncbi:MAG: HNH endonuclease [Burkholderiales bacterium]|nr:HNH endonuclease [Burkholderiales bacterium]
MERMSKERVIQSRVNFGNARQGEISSKISESPGMVAQKKKMQSIFGNAIQMQPSGNENIQSNFEPSAQLFVMTRSRYELYRGKVLEAFEKVQKSAESLWSVIHFEMDGCDLHDKQRVFDDVVVNYGFVIAGEEDIDTEAEDVSEADHAGGGNEEIEFGSEEYNKLTQMKRAGNRESAEKTFNTSSHGQYKKVAYKTDPLGNINFSSPTKSTQWGDPVDGASLVDLSHGSGVKGSDYGKMAGGSLVKIRGASRGQHCSIANRIKNTGAGSNSPANWTWHHLTTYPKMVLVDRAVHAKYGHNGGMLLW